LRHVLAAMDPISKRMHTINEMARGERRDGSAALE
jgi:hypothetical protein